MKTVGNTSEAAVAAAPHVPVKAAQQLKNGKKAMSNVQVDAHLPPAATTAPPPPGAQTQPSNARKRKTVPDGQEKNPAKRARGKKATSKETVDAIDASKENACPDVAEQANCKDTADTGEESLSATRRRTSVKERYFFLEVDSDKVQQPEPEVDINAPRATRSRNRTKS